MATRLTAPMVADIAEAVRSFTSAGPPTELSRLVALLREGNAAAFTPEQLDVAEAAASALCAPVDERPRWPISSPRGLFFVFEGLDRSGKSTQSKLLAKHLETVRSAARAWLPLR